MAGLNKKQSKQRLKQPPTNKGRRMKVGQSAKSTVHEKIKKTNPGKNPVGRPSSQDEGTIMKILGILKIDGTKEEACASAGIHVNTFDNWVKSQKKFLWEIQVIEGVDENNKPMIKKITKEVTFAELVDDALAYPFIQARMALFKNMKMGSQRAVDTFLQSRDPRYSAKAEFDVTTKQIMFGDTPSQFVKKSTKDDGSS